MNDIVPENDQASAKARSDGIRLTVCFTVMIFVMVCLRISDELHFELYRIEGTVNSDEALVEFLSGVMLVGISVFAAIVAIKRVIARRKVDAAVYALIALIGASLVCFHPELHISVLTLKARLFHERYQACRARAVEYAPGRRFGVCDWRTSIGVCEMVVIDTGNEVRKEESERSVEFRELMLHQSPLLSPPIWRVLDLSSDLRLVSESC